MMIVGRMEETAAHLLIGHVYGYKQVTKVGCTGKYVVYNVASVATHTHISSRSKQTQPPRLLRSKIIII